jgi:hypothetical protein
MSQVQVADRDQAFREARVILNVAENCIEDLGRKIDSLEAEESSPRYQEIYWQIILGISSLYKLSELVDSATSPAVLSEFRNSTSDSIEMPQG